MAKAGILHDYDLMANAEPAAAKGGNCRVCDNELSYQWSDYHGEAMCRHCGATYQLKGGTKEQESEGNYPYFTLKEEFVPVAREYWQETKKFACYGTMLGPRPGMRELVDWIGQRHPEWLAKDN